MVAVLWEDHLDAFGIERVDNSGDIEVSGASPAVEAKFSKHAWNIGLAFGDRVEVPDPGSGEGLVGGHGTIDDELGDFLEAVLGGEVDGALS